MKYLLLIVLLAGFGLAVAFPTEENPNNGTVFYRPTIEGRIVGGFAASIVDLPWQVAILRNGGQICGGVLVAPKVVLTAAHCIALSVIPILANLNIRSGSTSHHSGGSRITSERRIIHAQYRDNCPTCNPDYDIAVIHLTENGNIAPAAPIAIWEAHATFATGVIGIVSGWGATCENCVGASTLRRVDVPVVSAANCRAVYGSIITERTICAGFAAGGRDTCQGDSGGPYVIQNKLAGIISFGSGCARAGLPGVYSSIPGYRAWIRTNAVI